ncbi:MAG: NAD(P)-dependent oxidoreductase [Planctomycetes bacterium]|nr:NAD(P)-dependent oxidoreductase [Planctomycetota bacterium]
MILVTGNSGYIGSVMTRVLQEHSYEVIGLDCNYYNGCEFYATQASPSKQIVKDIRDVTEDDLEGVTDIIHLAALSNDPVGELNPSLTNEINYTASVNLAKLAKKNGVQRFVFSSSCSLYGISSDSRPLTETDTFNPITAYAKTKVKVEQDISKLADSNFHPVFMRNATVYGISPCLRLDLVVNNLVAWAYLTGDIAIMSDGTPWRPLIHVEDLCLAFIAALQADSEKIHNQAFNVGINEGNYQVKDVAIEIEKIVPDSHSEILNKTGVDERTYRVDFSKIKEVLPGFKPAWNLRKGIGDIYQTYKDFGLTKDDLDSDKYFRVRWLKYLIENKKIDENIRWRCSTSA